MFAIDTYRQPPRPFIRRQQLIPLPPVLSKAKENNNHHHHHLSAAPAPPRPVIVKRPPPVRVVRRIHHLGVTQADPQAYLACYGSSLLDSVTLVKQIRSIGIFEDISFPVTCLVNSKDKNFIDIFIPS